MAGNGQYLIDYQASPSARMTPAPIGAVTLDGGFWGRVFRTNWEVTIPHVFEHVRDDLFGKFRRAADPGFRPAGEPSGSNRAREANLHRWMEAAACSLSHPHDESTADWIRQALDLIEPVQDFDGYLHVNLAPRNLAGRRWRDGGLNELYASGHLIQGAIAHHRNTGSERYLAIACRVADHMCDVFLPGGSQMRPSHPVVEMALVELYRVTGNRRYLELACHFIEHVGSLEMEEIAGHSVQITFLACGIVDAYAETGRAEYWEASERLWHDMVARKMYVTGALGGRRVGEAMGHDYELPHEHAYAETCAAIGSAMWGLRALQVSGEARFADLMELCWHNSILCGVNLAGDRFFYDNPLQSSGRGYFDPWRPPLTPASHDYEYYHSWLSGPTRQEWFWVDRPRYRHMYRVACCPPNLTRSIAQLPAYFYSHAPGRLWVHLYGRNRLDLATAGGRVKIRQTTDYPWDGRIELEIEQCPPGEYSINLRIPGWARRARAESGGQELSGTPGSYLEIRRRWTAGAKITLELAMPVELISADRAVAEARDCVALKRGPLVYAIEEPDHPGEDFRRLRVPAGISAADVSVVPESDLLGGTVTLRAPGLRAPNGARPLYAPADSDSPAAEAVDLKAVPYFAWDNRDRHAQMAIWLPRHRGPVGEGSSA